MLDAPKQLEINYPKIDFNFTPDLLRDLIKLMENQMQIDPVIPFGSALGVIATATGGRVKVWIADS